MAEFYKILQTGYGAADVLQVVDAARIEPKPNEVRVKLIAAGVGFSDLMAQRGGYPLAPRLPFTPGYDLVGVVDAVGRDVTTLQIGQTVAALNPKFGGYAEMQCLPAKLAVPVPEGCDPVEVVALILNYLTAYALLSPHRKLGLLPKGQSILIHGAAGGVGTALMQLGQLAGLQMYGTASAAKHRVLEQYGVVAIDYQHQDFVQRILAETDGLGVDAAFDPIGGKNIWRTYRCVKRGGRFTSYAFQSSGYGGRLPMVVGVLQLGLLHMIPDRKQIGICAIPHRVKTENTWYRATLSELLGLLAEGKLRPVVAAQMPLREARRAHELLATGNTSGKIVLVSQWAH